MLIFLRILIPLLCFFMATGAYAAEMNVNKIVAVVNGDMITLHELRLHTASELARRRIAPNDARAEQIQSEVLDHMINDTLIRQEAKRYKLSAPDQEIDKEYEDILKRSGKSQAQFEMELEKQGMTPSLLRQQLTNNMLRQRVSHFMVARKVFVTPEEVSDYYEKHKAEMVSPKTVDFSIMFLPEKLNVQNIYGQLKSGAISFEETAKKHSTDSTAKDGGAVSDIPWDRLPPEMQKLLSSLQPGKMTPLLRTQGAFVILRLNAIHESRQLSFQEAAPRVEEKLLQPLLEERFKEFVGQLRSKAVIDIRL